MKKVLTLIFIFTAIATYAQEVVTLSKYKCLNGWQISKKGQLILGSPIDTEFTTIANRISPRNRKKYLSGSYKDSVFTIQNLTKYTWDGGLVRVYAEIEAAGDQYYVDIEQAIGDGELEIPEGYSRTSKKYPVDLQRFLERQIDSIPVKDGRIFYDKIVEAPGRSKESLFSAIRQWFVETFKDSKDVIEVSDLTSGLITGKASFNYAAVKGWTSAEGHITFVLAFAIKDGKFRYQMYNFNAEGVRSDFNLFADRGSVRTSQNFDLSQYYAKYKEGGLDKKESTLIKQYLTSLLGSVGLLKISIAKIGKDDSKDISQF